MNPLLIHMEHAYTEAFRGGIGTPGFGFHEEPGLTRVTSPLPTPWFNAVLSCQLEGAERDEAIERVLAHHRSTGTPLLWRLGPATVDPVGLREKLDRHGFHPAPPSTAIVGELPRALDLWKHLPLPYVGRRVDDATQHARWFQVFGPNFGVPAAHQPLFAATATRLGFGLDNPQQHLLLERGGQPIACTTTQWSPGDPFASLFNFAAAASVRRGLTATAMLAYAAYHLRERGCEAIGQFSSPAGARFYTRVTATKVLGTFENRVWLG